MKICFIDISKLKLLKYINLKHNMITNYDQLEKLRSLSSINKVSVKLKFFIFRKFKIWLQNFN